MTSLTRSMQVPPFKHVTLAQLLVATQCALLMSLPVKVEKQLYLIELKIFH